MNSRPYPLPLVRRLVDGADGATALTVLMNELRSGERVPDHIHNVEEILMVTAGRCEFVVGSSTTELAAGDAVIVPPRTVHGFRAVGPQPAAVTAVLASPDPQMVWTEETA
jgi:quercetin dioxygenase-like cupin family protein